MNNASDSIVVDSSLNSAGDSVTGSSMADSSMALVMPTAEQLGISVETGVAPALTIGDTFNFPVVVSWSVNGSALLVLPTSSANAKGITQLGVSQESARFVANGVEKASITFNYKLVVQDTGNLSIPALKFEIPTQVGTPIEMRSESVPLRVEAPFNVVPFVVGAVVAICIIVAGVWRMRRRAETRAYVAARNAAQDELREKMFVLKQRINTADSREWLLELENICKEQVPEKFAAANSCENAENSLNVNNVSDGWESLLNEFAHARYGGGKRDAFELREIWKGAMKLMGVQEEE